jgi:hypothetical protein
MSAFFVKNCMASLMIADQRSLVACTGARTPFLAVTHHVSSVWIAVSRMPSSFGMIPSSRRQLIAQAADLRMIVVYGTPLLTKTLRLTGNLKEGVTELKIIMRPLAIGRVGRSTLFVGAH